MENNNYVRIGTTLYKIIKRPTFNGYKIERQVWSYEALKQDYNKEFISHIPKYDGFCLIPEHVNYKPVYDNFINEYEPVDIIPQEGRFETIKALIRHIFNEHYELGLDYIQILYTMPIEKLPILILVSNERNTGKSTFVNFLKHIFKGNLTFNTNENFRNRFNSDWTKKLIIAIEETKLGTQDDSETLKNLSTCFYHKEEAKGKDRSETIFFGKFILCSNNENNPVQIEKGETRYWVRKISSIKEIDIDMEKKLVEEIPHFIYFLLNRTLSTTKESRMWFRPDLYYTDALHKMIAYSKNRIEQSLKEYLLEIMDNMEVDELSFCVNDLTYSLSQFLGSKVDRVQIRQVLQNIWRLQPINNTSTYTTYIYSLGSETSYIVKKAKGRFYSVDREKLTLL